MAKIKHGPDSLGRFSHLMDAVNGERIQSDRKNLKPHLNGVEKTGLVIALAAAAVVSVMATKVRSQEIIEPYFDDGVYRYSSYVNQGIWDLNIDELKQTLNFEGFNNIGDPSNGILDYFSELDTIHSTEFIKTLEGWLISIYEGCGVQLRGNNLIHFVTLYQSIEKHNYRDAEDTIVILKDIFSEIPYFDYAIDELKLIPQET